MAYNHGVAEAIFEAEWKKKPPNTKAWHCVKIPYHF